MAGENVRIVRGIYESLNRDDLDTAYRKLHPGFEMTLPPGPNGGTHRGRAEVDWVLRDLREPFESWVTELEEVHETDDSVVVTFVTTRVRPKGTDAELTFRNGHVWTFRDGKALSFRAFPQPGDALEAAGLRG